MQESTLQEQVLGAWIGLNSILKDSQMTDGMTYNEAIIMYYVWKTYCADGIGRTPVRQIVQQTNMLKSLVNRTINALCAQGYLTKEQSGRNLYVLPLPDRLEDFLAVHQRSLQTVRTVIDAIGPEDAAAFVRIYQKLQGSSLY